MKTRSVLILLYTLALVSSVCITACIQDWRSRTTWELPQVPDIEHIQILIGTEPDGIIGPKTNKEWGRAIMRRRSRKLMGETHAKDSVALQTMEHMLTMIGPAGRYNDLEEFLRDYRCVKELPLARGFQGMEFVTLDRVLPIILSHYRFELEKIIKERWEKYTESVKTENEK